jgi:hypothetical protein
VELGRIEKIKMKVVQMREEAEHVQGCFDFLLAHGLLYVSIV